MTVPAQENSGQQEQKMDNKELNFRNLEARYEKQLQQERAARLEAERKMQELSQKPAQLDEDDDDSEPYIDQKRFNKKLNTFEKHLEKKIEQMAETKARTMLDQERQTMWMKSNPDFQEVMQHAQRFAETNPDLAETILQMPDSFARQQLVYNTIKGMGIHKPAQKEPSIQERIDANRKSPYYQPSQVATAPYAMTGDFSPVGQKNAYDKMQELKRNLRL